MRCETVQALWAAPPLHQVVATAVLNDPPTVYTGGSDGAIVWWKLSSTSASSQLEPQPIDWEYYRKGIGSRLVDMYKEAYENVKIPKYVDKVTPEYKPKFDALLKEARQAEINSLQESERLEKEIAKIQELKYRRESPP